MESYDQILEEETEYLQKIVTLLKIKVDSQTKDLSSQKTRLISSRKDMWENTVHHTNDFTRLTELNQYLAEVNNKTAVYNINLQSVEKYKNMIPAPFFGRFDFAEDSLDIRENVYIGLHNLADPQTQAILVYDWRAPISSIFYRYEPGRAAFQAPGGMVHGEVLLKRQFKIRDSRLDYFFDCSLTINDEILQEILSRNSSPRMRNIVETIQKEQDVIIRDSASELLIVQGAAGSGKTSIALHRVAFLLYEGLNSGIGSHNLLIISPNALFSNYISSVLPGLGEENVEQTTFDEIAAKLLDGRVKLETRDQQLEALIHARERRETAIRRQSIEFKSSKLFAKILEGLLWYYEHRMLAPVDISYHGTLLMTRQEFKNRFLNDKSGLTMAKRLQRLENIILDKVHPLQKKRLQKIEKIVANSEGHDLEIKSFSRLLSIKDSKLFVQRLQAFTKVDYLSLYKELFSDPNLLIKLSQGLCLPDDIEQIISCTGEKLDQGQAPYEDCAPLIYLKLRIEGIDLFAQIEQVIIDEAQDYSHLQYEVFNLLFGKSRYTVLGDVEQAVEKETDQSLYEDIAETLHKKKTVKLILKKAYRSSYEINTFTCQLLGKEADQEAFERHGTEPRVEAKETVELMEQAIINDILFFVQEGHESVAVICKTLAEAKVLHAQLVNQVSVNLITPQTKYFEKGISVIPSYMSKGLEFDVVIIPGVDNQKYDNEFDRKLLYVACTRALHHLILYYTGEKSRLLP